MAEFVAESYDFLGMRRIRALECPHGKNFDSIKPLLHHNSMLIIVIIVSPRKSYSRI